MIDDLSGWRWINEPANWTAGEDLRITAEARTDLWQTTFYNYKVSSAHMFGTTVTGDALLTATFGGAYAAQYDQAGLVLHIDDENWIKAGAEYVDGGLHLSTVVTRGFSDWSVTVPAKPSQEITLDLQKKGDAVVVRYGLDGAKPETMLRLAYFPPGPPALAGVMCAAPSGPGFETRFTHVTIK
ncbi:DUF1349 domain-containing protein [Sphaerisporangium rubeum]|uniref:DUF1349 domain-containing protein n=1 Tax=Sphaerisporangium rubeum TaxID=321317 RepID=A0A7X0M7Y0_9ACTN|nr:DUF1349 domain-containing protein [Sphaerisporangium rubeum]MBB6474782.1 hypothetical protein [Sphaerisporangium rubeum]